MGTSEEVVLLACCTWRSVGTVVGSMALWAI
jgi:hypothetical protein